MRIGAQGLALIKHFEGFSAVPYEDVAGLRTIGYGHLLRAGEEWREVSRAEAEALLQQDVWAAERGVARFIEVPLAQYQFDALVSFTFNLGVGALQRSALRRCVNRQAHEEVPGQLMRWVWAGGRKWAGLQRRREAEARLYAALQ